MNNNINYEKDYKVGFHRHGNEVKVSIRNKQTGGVGLQWIVTMEQVLSELAEDYAERNTNVGGLN